MSDRAPLTAALEETLTRETGGPTRVTGVAPVPGGACQENFRVDAELTAGPLAGARRFCLRSDSAASLPGSIDRAAEFEVIGAAVAAGVPTPTARWLTADLVREGAHAYLLDWVEGQAIGARVVRHASLAAARERLPSQLAAALAAIHRVTPDAAPDLPLVGRDEPAADRALAFLRATLDRLPEAHPALELGHRWLRERPPERAPTTLVHGDFRVGNFLVTDGGLAAILDWEFARWGDPAEDVAWLCLRDWRFGAVDRPAGGITDRATFYAAYAEASGSAVDPARVHWWEVLGNLTWGAAAVFQGERYLSGSTADLEMLAIPRRVCEMEFEALRLIELGPSA